MMRFAGRGLIALGMLVALASPLHAEGWREGAPMTTARANAGGVLVGEDLYVIGGASTSGPRSLTEVYDTIGNIWRAAAALPVGLEQFGIASDGNKIFVAGGYETENVLGGKISESANLWIYDLKSGSWSAGPDMPSPRVGLSLACVDGKLYAIGGRGPQAARIFAYDIGNQRWRILKTSNPAPRADSAAVVVGDAIYVIGGKEGNRATARVDIFNPAHETWRNGPALPSPREGHVAALLDGKIHVSGGQSLSPPKTYPDHFVLNIKSGVWSKAAPLPTPRHGAVAAAGHGKFFVVGGAPGAGVYTVFTLSDLVNIYSGS